MGFNSSLFYGDHPVPMFSIYEPKNYKCKTCHDVRWVITCGTDTCEGVGRCDCHLYGEDVCPDCLPEHQKELDMEGWP